MCVGKKAAFLGENVMSKKREHMLAMRCGGQGWISQKVDVYYLTYFNTETGFCTRVVGKCYLCFLCKLKYCHYLAPGPFKYCVIKGGVQGEILEYNSAENLFDMVIEKSVGSSGKLIRN